MEVERSTSQGSRACCSVLASGMRRLVEHASRAVLTCMTAVDRAPRSATAGKDRLDALVQA